MKSHRHERAQEQIRQDLTEILETEVVDPEIPSVSITNVKLAPDYSEARVFVCLQDVDPKDAAEAALRPLRRAQGFLRTLLAERVAMRRVPRLDFRLDQGKINADRVETLLARIKKRAKTDLAVLLFVLLAARPDALFAETPFERYEASASIMGATYQIALYGEKRGPLASAALAAFDEARRIDAFLSNYKPDSELTRLNQRAGDRPIAVSAELANLLADCLDYSRASDGAFDVTVGRLMRVWGFYKGEGRLPGQRDIDRALARSGYERLVVDREAATVRFAVSDLEIDPGGIGKGYAVERMADLLRDYGISSAMISAGSSSMYAIGTPPDEPRGWRVRLRNPRDRTATEAEIFLKDESLSTSGSYEKFFKVDGKTYSHIVDPRTGWPAQGTLAVSVRAPSALDSEAWTTALFVNGQEWAEDRAPAGMDVFFCPASGPCSWLR